MDSKAYIWLFNNISKYNFSGSEAISIRNELSRMLVTEDSLKSDVIFSKMQGLYSGFCGLFYNNIFGYQNGLANKGITASELDCYFIQVSDGLVPIGYYRTVRPAESALIVQRYLDMCKNELSSDKNNLINEWQSNINSISEKYDSIKTSGNPNICRGILGIFVSFLLLLFPVISLFRMNIIGIICNLGNSFVVKQLMSGIPFLSNGSEIRLVIYILLILLSLLLSLLGLIFAIIEFKLTSDKSVTIKLLGNMLSYVNQIEQGINNTSEVKSAAFYDAARKGMNIGAAKNQNSALIRTVNSQIKTAVGFVSKSDSKRTGISYKLIVLFFVVVLIFIFSWLPIFGNSSKSGSGADITDVYTCAYESFEELNENAINVTISEGIMDLADFYIQNLVPPKTKEYKVIKSNDSWNRASQNAFQMGGYLVCINDADEFEEVCRLADSINIKVFWVGARRNRKDSWNNVRWLDGEYIGYSRWLQGEPSYTEQDSDIDECYLMVFKVGNSWYFNDAIEDVSKYYNNSMGYIVELEE